MLHLSGAKRVAVVVFCSVTVPLAAQQATAPALEVASVKQNLGSDLRVPIGAASPDRIDLINRPLDTIIRTAYNLPFEFQLTGMPSWASSERFDVRIKANGPIADAERLKMLQSLLAERFRLRVHSETQTRSAYVLVRIPDKPLGSGLRRRAGCDPPNDCTKLGGNISIPTGIVNFRGGVITTIASILTGALNRPVHNETGVDGHYDIELSWRPDNGNVDDPRPSLFTAVQEQLGLRLVVQQRPTEVLVIDSVERPTPD